MREEKSKTTLKIVFEKKNEMEEDESMIFRDFCSFSLLVSIFLNFFDFSRKRLGSRKSSCGFSWCVDACDHRVGSLATCVGSPCRKRKIE